ncbi:MAG: DUF3318 domain-containing protein [Cyanobacteria bacterium P01_H01_bin.15]
MNPQLEISRLLDLMPASGRMFTKLVSKPQQPQVIATRFPAPWNREARAISINFSLWFQLSQPEQDLLLLRAVTGLTNIRWFKPDLYQGAALAGLLGLGVELFQTDVIGILVAGGLTTMAVTQVWRNNRSTGQELAADEAALKVAERRGYSRKEAARYLMTGLEAAMQLEGRSSLDFIELVRSQNLKAIATLSPVSIPEKVRQR